MRKTKLLHFRLWKLEFILFLENGRTKYHRQWAKKNRVRRNIIQKERYYKKKYKCNCDEDGACNICYNQK